MRRFCALILLCGGWCVLGYDVASAEEDTAAVLGKEIGLTPRMQYFKRVKLFDFDERDAGNFEDRPMHWNQLLGPGLPPYGEGVFDFEVGRDAPPSFRLSTELQSVAFEYRYPDLDVIPGADYRLIGYVKAEGVQHSRAFISAYFVDRFGETLDSTRTVSRLIHSVGGSEEPWQRIEMMLRGQFPEAYALRLRVWILQSHNWRHPSSDAVDPIIYEDVNPRVWFDDIALYRLPRAELSFKPSPGVIEVGDPGALMIRVHNATDQTLSGRIAVRNTADEVVHRDELVIPANRSIPFERALPTLPMGEYAARLVLATRETDLLARDVRFVVLNRFEEGQTARSDICADIGTQRIYDAENLLPLITALEVGAIRVGIPVVGPLDSPIKAAYFEELSELVFMLMRERVGVAAVLLSPTAISNLDYATATRQMVAHDTDWRERLRPILAKYIGGKISTWQLGAERTDTGGLPWTTAMVADIRREMERFISLPDVILPVSVLDPHILPSESLSYWVPEEIPTRDLPSYLEDFTRRADGARWLTLEGRDYRHASYRDSMTDLARRIVVAKALDPHRLVVPAPFELALNSGTHTWQPREGFAVVRTLAHFLAGKRAVGGLRLGDDGIAVVFDGPADSCVVAWTWASAPERVPARLFLGDKPQQIDLWGNRKPVEVEQGEALLHLKPTPMIITDVDAPLALVQTSFRISPNYVQIHDETQRPVVRFRNHYDQPLRGELSFRAPKHWDVQPNNIRFDIPAGGSFEQQIDILVPNRQIASTQYIGVELKLRDPRPATLAFTVPMTVGLKDIMVEAAVRFEDQLLIIEHALTNLSKRPVSFQGFCQVPMRPRASAMFLDIQPGERRVERYVFSDSDVEELIGMEAHLRILESGGDRELDQLLKLGG